MLCSPCSYITPFTLPGLHLGGGWGAFAPLGELLPPLDFGKLIQHMLDENHRCILYAIQALEHIKESQQKDIKGELF